MFKNNQLRLLELYKVVGQQAPSLTFKQGTEPSNFRVCLLEKYEVGENNELII